MPKANLIREKIVKMLLSDGSLNRRKVEYKFNVSDRPKARQEVSNLIGEGIIILTGRGTRKAPYMLHRSPIWPFHERCALCGQKLPLEPVLIEENENNV